MKYEYHAEDDYPHWLVANEQLPDMITMLLTVFDNHPSGLWINKQNQHQNSIKVFRSKRPRPDPPDRIVFKNQDDAMLFKLTFG